MSIPETKNISADELEALKGRVRKLKREAAETSMELHDLTEELPGAYLKIMDTAHTTFLKHREYFEAAEKLKQLEGGSK
jgi:hypothetical protein